jgi:hypothetical protein
MRARHLVLALSAWTVGLTLAACGGGSPTSPSTVASTSDTGTPSSGTPSGSVTVAYVNDIKPILDSDCITCHGPRVRENNVDLSTYAGVLRVAQAGNANSLIVRETRSNGAMYVNLTGDRAAKSALIRSWVVDNGVAESR